MQYCILGMLLKCAQCLSDTQWPCCSNLGGVRKVQTGLNVIFLLLFATFLEHFCYDEYNVRFINLKGLSLSTSDFSSLCCFMYFMDGPFANPDPEDDGREPLEQDDAFLDQLRGVAHTHEPEYDRASNEGLRILC